MAGEAGDEGEAGRGCRIAKRRDRSIKQPRRLPAANGCGPGGNRTRVRKGQEFKSTRVNLRSRSHDSRSARLTFSIVRPRCDRSSQERGASGTGSRCSFSQLFCPIVFNAVNRQPAARMNPITPPVETMTSPITSYHGIAKTKRPAVDHRSKADSGRSTGGQSSQPVGGKPAATPILNLDCRSVNKNRSSEERNRYSGTRIPELFEPVIWYSNTDFN